MRGIYFSQDLSHAPGIEKKIFNQIEEFQSEGWEIEKRINPKRNFMHLLKNVVPFFSKQYFYTQNIDWQTFDFVYLRKGAVFDQSFIKLVKQAKRINPKIKVIVEIPTFPYMNEFNGLLKLDILIKERFVTNKLYRYVDKIVTYSDDEKIFGIPCLNISNAYEFNQIPSFEKNQKEGIHLLAVAALTFYHGYDRLIEGIKNYYQQNSVTEKVVFTLIGDGPVLKEYQEKVAAYHLEDYIKLLGRKPFEELGEYYQLADIGIDSLGRHRSGVAYNSSLKGKEYLAKGLPIVSGVKTDLDGKNLDFYKRVPADDSPLDVQLIVDWYQKLRVKEDKNQLADRIYNYGTKNFSFKKTFLPVMNYIKGE